MQRQSVGSCSLILAVACLAAVADTGAQSNNWRQCLTDTSPAAIEACTSIIFLDPQNDGAFVNRGIAYRRDRRSRTGASRLRRSHSTEPARRRRVQQSRQCLSEDLNEFDRAVRGLRRSDSAEPALRARVQQSRRASFSSAGEPGLAAADFARRSDAMPATQMRSAIVGWRGPISASSTSPSPTSTTPSG